MNTTYASSIEARGTFSKKILWGLLGVMTLSVFVFDEIPLLTKTNPDYVRLWTERLVLFPHAALGTLALLIGPFQFSRRFRERNFPRHRLLGKIYVSAVLLSAPLGALLGYQLGGLFSFAVYVQVALWTLTTVAAFITARNRQIMQHRQWMARSYAVTFIFVSSRVLDVIPSFKNMDPATSACVVLFINLLAILIPDIAQSWRAFRTKAV